MVLTRKEAKVACSHVLENFLGRSDCTALMTSLDEEGTDDIVGLINIIDAAIYSLCYKDTSYNDVTTPV
jgi:hypothetical protein